MRLISRFGYLNKLLYKFYLLTNLLLNIKLDLIPHSNFFINQFKSIYYIQLIYIIKLNIKILEILFLSKFSNLYLLK